ncbi:MAG: flagellin, partial [Planctomycetota bacterium]
LATSLKRLATGLRINEASDDPSGLVISEQLRAQIASLKQASENAQNANNLLSTTEAALAEVNSLLIQIREAAVFASNTGGASAEQINAEQDAVDQAIEAIDRIAATTRFASRQLLNGQSGFNIRNVASAITDLTPISMTFDQRSSQTTFSLVLNQNASQGLLSAVGASGMVASGGNLVLRVTGELGTEDISLATGATSATFANAINILRGNTGIYASGGVLYSEEFGSDAVVRVDKVGGSGAWSGGGGTVNNIGDFVDDLGVDAAGALNGVSARGQGNSLSVVSSVFTGSLEMSALSTPGTYTFTVRNSGLLFQLSDRAVPSDQAIIGLPNVYSNVLGRRESTTSGITQFGYLSTLTSGGKNDLLTTPGNAIKIIDVAINQISDIRAFLGAFSNDNIEPALRELSVHIENLTASESTIRDLDFAAETAELTKNQVLFQAGISVLAQANAIPQAVIQLLQ